MLENEKIALQKFFKNIKKKIMFQKIQTTPTSLKF